MSEQLPNDADSDARLAALYRAAADDQPPPALDDAIRAAARRAVASKPRLAGAPFGSSWRVPLSIAALVVLSVSLVTLMRDEAPEIVQPPGAELSQQSAPRAEQQIPAAPKTLADGQNASGLGLKPPQPSSSSGLGLRSKLDSTPPARLRKQIAPTEQMESARSAPPSGSASAPEAFPGASALQDNNIAAPVEPPRQAGRDETRRDRPATAELQRSPVIAGAPAESKPLLRSEADGSVSESKRMRGPETSARAAAKPVPAPMASAPADDKVQPAQKSEGAQGSVGERVPQGRTQVKPAEPSAPAINSIPAPAVKPGVPAFASKALRENPAAAAADTVRADVGLPPEQWLARIEALHTQGKLAEARASLVEFRKRYPDYALPASLKDGMQP